MAVWTLAVSWSAALPALPQTVVDPPKDSPSKDKKDDGLARKLIEGAAGETDDDLMASITRLMTDAARRLEVRFDPGEETQQVQQEIMTKLDEAVSVAAAQRRPHRSRSQSASSDKRRMPKNRPPNSRAQQDNRAQAAAPDASTAQRTDSVRPDAVRGPDGELLETRRTWGHLPMREREEIIQGIGEQFLERYREWIERYYRALQEADE